jgi:hypothetical protein
LFTELQKASSALFTEPQKVSSTLFIELPKASSTLFTELQKASSTLFLELQRVSSTLFTELQKAAQNYQITFASFRMHLLKEAVFTLGTVPLICVFSRKRFSARNYYQWKYLGLLPHIQYSTV